jgi:hypothetical protein
MTGNAAGSRISIVFFAVAFACHAQTPERQFLDHYCVGCHNEKLKTAGLMLDKMNPLVVGADPAAWEKVVRKLRAGMMPPSGAPRPQRAVLDAFAGELETALDVVAEANPNPGTTIVHRLNRAEYANAIRDLIGVDVDVSTLLPSDDSSEGFDNIAEALGVSPALLERYVSAATKISRIAVGDPSITAVTDTYRVPGDLSQTDHIEGLPLGTRGGFLFRYTFPLDAEYIFKIRARSAGIGVGAGAALPELEVTVDGARVTPTRTPGSADLRLAIKAGPHSIGVALPSRISRVWMTFMRAMPTTPRCRALPSRARSIPPVRGTRRAAAGSSSAIRIHQPPKLPARNESLARLPAMPTAGQSGMRTSKR